MTERKVIELLKKLGQQHILDHSVHLTPEKRNEFLGELKNLDLALVFRLHNKFSTEFSSPSLYDIGRAPIIPIPETPGKKARREEARTLGESLIRQNRVAVLIVAGGQGSRLGFEGPKGKLPISPIKKKSLFQLLAESLKASSSRYGASIPLLIMTNRENAEETQRFFAANQFFGLERDRVYFFDQGMLPTITPEGKLILKGEAQLLANPDGHGGSLKALYESGFLQHLMEKGYSELSYCQVDNPLVKILDPVFIGYHKMEGAEISTKVVRRRNLEEKVGIYGMLNGKPAIIEYSDFRPEDYCALDKQGRIRHWAGNTAIHMISFPFIQRLNVHGFALPYHRVVKEVEGLGPEGQKLKMSGWKFEAFVFDSIPLARKTCCMEVIREEEFAPVKNQEGSDSPDTARAAMNDLHRGWLREATVEIDPEARVEISPLYALDREELLGKLKGEKLEIRADLYIGAEFSL